MSTAGLLAHEKDVKLVTTTTKSVYSYSDDNWDYYDTFTVENGIETFYCKSLKLTSKEYNKKFGILDNPLSYMSATYGYVIDHKKWEALINKYEDDYYSCVWYLHVATTTAEDINAVIDIILTGVKLRPTDIKYYLNQLKDGKITKQDGKDILARIEAGEDSATVYSDPKYVKIDNTEEIVLEIIAANQDKLSDPKTIDKMKTWLAGQVMKVTKGKCSPLEVKELINKHVK